MAKWEYLSVDIEGCNLDSLGEIGWELVSVEDGIAYFKRPIETMKWEIVSKRKRVY